MINIAIPENKNLPNIGHFSPEENYLILKIGSECLLESRKLVAGLTQQEIYQKIKDASQKDVDKLEMNLIVERETSKKMEEKLGKIYDTQIEQLKKQNNILLEQLKKYELDTKHNIQDEINKIKEKYDIQLREKEKQIDKLNDNYDKINEKLLIQKNKSVNTKGIEGEKKFRDYADTFKDFKGFEVVDKHTQSGEGDFHLHFEEFDILVDAKNYKNGVPSKEREKIKNDLLKNEHINFAWLVSLNTSIDKFDRCPIMSEWITTDKCIIYINNLTSFEEPKRILRVAWFYCNDLMKFIGKVDTEEILELKDIKNKQFKIMDKIKTTRKQIRELNTTVGIFKKQIDTIDYELKDLLNYEAENILDSNFSLFDEWWKTNVELVNDERTIISTDIWTIFKQDNKELIKEFDITAEKFKEYIKSKVPSSSLLIRSNNKGAIDIKGIKLKTREKSIKGKSDTKEKMEVEFV